MLSEMVCVNDKFYVWKTRQGSFQERLQRFTGLMNVQHGPVNPRVIFPPQRNAPHRAESTWLTRGKRTEVPATHNIPLRLAA